MPVQPITNRRRVFEFIAVVITGLGKFLFVDVLQLKFWYILAACLFWITYILFRIRRDPELPAYWGFRRDGLRESLRWLVPFAVISLIGFIAYGTWREVIIIHWHIIPILLLYPCWGILQQFLIIGLIARNLSDYDGRKLPTFLIVLIASTIFSIVHYPVLLLVIGTFVLALLYCLVYLRYRNLWVLGVLHGWLGGLFYFFVLGRDPWVEFLAAVQK